MAMKIWVVGFWVKTSGGWLLMSSSSGCHNSEIMWVFTCICTYYCQVWGFSVCGSVVGLASQWVSVLSHLVIIYIEAFTNSVLSNAPKLRRLKR
jgi:hypothetical protein